jgi:hypothetical protein
MAEFKTVPDELLHVADAIVEHLDHAGYELRIEITDLGFPFTPLVTGVRNHETLIVELSTLLDEARISRWVKFCRSQSADTRLCLVLGHEEAHKEKVTAFCHNNRIGLFSFHDGQVVEFRQPVDLAVNIDLPDLKDIKPKLRPLLANAFKKISNGEWRDGLGDIYLAIEEKAREYLVQGIDRTRITSVVKGKIVTIEKVERMTLGQLSVAFANIQNQNQQDSLISSTLEMINPTRVALTHKRSQQTAEEAIRRDVGKHVYAAINCLEEILK